jgi:hypothetical protein
LMSTFVARCQLQHYFNCPSAPSLERARRLHEVDMVGNKPGG